MVVVIIQVIVEVDVMTIVVVAVVVDCPWKGESISMHASAGDVCSFGCSKPSVLNFVYTRLVWARLRRQTR